MLAVCWGDTDQWIYVLSLWRYMLEPSRTQIQGSRVGKLCNGPQHPRSAFQGLRGILWVVWWRTREGIVFQTGARAWEEERKSWTYLQMSDICCTANATSHTYRFNSKGSAYIPLRPPPLGTAVFLLHSYFTHEPQLWKTQVRTAQVVHRSEASWQIGSSEIRSK